MTRCTSYEAFEVEAAVKKAVDLLGGIDRFVKPGEKVLIKPNLLTDAAPEEGIDTHPEVVRAVIRLIKPVTRAVFVGDSPSVWGEKRDVERVYELSGIKKVCLEEGATPVFFTSPKMRGRYPLTDCLDQMDRLVNVPKFKTHGFTVLTAGVKNLFGLVVGMNKMKIHRDFPHPDDLSKAIVDIYEIRNPDLTILDGVTAMYGEGPGSAGTLWQASLIAACPDALALDMVLARIMGLKPSDIPTNAEAIRRGLVSADASALEIAGDDIREFIPGQFILPKANFISGMPRPVLSLVRFFLRMKPDIIADRCRLCGTCVPACPGHAMTRKADRMRIDFHKCIYCLCSQEICPHGAVAVRKNLLLRLLNR